MIGENVELYHLLLITTAIGVPVLVVPYSWLVGYGLTSATRYRYRPAHDSLFYTSFVGLAAVVVVASPLGLSFAPDVLALGAVPLGGVMYWVDARVWEWIDERPVRVTEHSVGDTITFLLAPLPEEIVYRGGLAVVLPWFGPGGFVVTSAVLFGVNHYQLGTKEVAFKTWNGVVYALLFLHTGSLVAPTAAHLGYNLVYLWFVRRRASDPPATETGEVST